jgi:hypothetical protein
VAISKATRECDTDAVLDDDPGWPLVGLIPFIGPVISRRRRRSGQVDGLVTMRQVFLAFCMAIVLFGYVLVFLEPGDTERPQLAAAILVVGLLSLIAGPIFERPLACGDAVELKKSYTNRFFIRVAFSEAAALLGLMGFFVTNEQWVYPCAALITFVGFARAAPTRRALQRDQERLQEQGCTVSLAQALRTPLPPRKG